MIIDWLRAILSISEDRARIDLLTSRIDKLASAQEASMARIDDLSAVTHDIAALADALVAHVNDINARLAVAGVEDPAVGVNADALTAIRDKLAALIPAPAPVEEPAAG